MKRKLISEIKAQAVLAKLFADEELARQKAAMDRLNELISSARLGSATAHYEPRSMLSREDRAMYSLDEYDVVELDSVIDNLADSKSVRSC